MAPGNKSGSWGRSAGKRSKKKGSTSKRRRPHQHYYVQHTDKDMLLLISGNSDQEEGVTIMKRPRRKEAEVADKTVAVGSSWGTVMPLEILHKIFQILVDSEGAVPSLCRVSQVCRLWCEVGSSPALWQRLSVSRCWVIPKKHDSPRIQQKVQKTMGMLMQSRLSMTTEFSLHHWTHLVPFILQNLSTSCPLLTSLTLSHCSRVTTNELLSVAHHCPRLDTLNLQDSQLESNTFSQILEVCGARLKCLYLTFSVQTNSMLSKLASGSCPDLRFLEINTAMKENATQLNISIEAIQASCPKLQVMRLLNLPWAPKSPARHSVEQPGFTQLQELCLATSTYTFIDDSVCKRLLSSCTKLRVLDVRGCYKLSPQGISDLPCTDLERLYMGMYYCTMRKVLPGSGCHLLTRRWQHSLQELDLTGQAFSEEDLDRALEILSRGGHNNTLQSLLLTGTKVRPFGVSLVLSSCKALIHLDLSSCRNLPRGLKRVYRGEEEIQKCLSDLTSKDLEETGE